MENHLHGHFGNLAVNVCLLRENQLIVPFNPLFFSALFLKGIPSPYAFKIFNGSLGFHCWIGSIVNCMRGRAWRCYGEP